MGIMGKKTKPREEQIEQLDGREFTKDRPFTKYEPRYSGREDESDGTEYEETPEEKWEAKLRDYAEKERASWEAGGNLINEAGVLCDLDELTVAELYDKLAHSPEYEIGQRRGDTARKRLLSVLERKKRERDSDPSQMPTKLEAMTAKELVAHLWRDATDTYMAYAQGFDGTKLLEVLERLNREAAVVKVGHAVKYMVNGTDYAGQPELRFLSAKDFHALYTNVIVPRQAAFQCGLVTKDAGADLKLSKLWDEWKGRRELEGIGFFPGSPKHKAIVPKGYLNMWSGLAVEPKQGDWSLFRSHLRDKVCGGNQEQFDFLMDWLAQAVQRPQEKPGSAIVIRSAQKGSGKSMLLKFLRGIFGRHLYSAAKADQLTGRFNGHLEETLIFGVEEGFWAGNHAANSILKDLITSEHIAIERKGLDSKNAPNFTRLIFLSNESWVVPAGTDERRYFVLDFEHDRAKDQTYFDPIFRQMEQEGGVEAMLFELMGREIKANLRNPPTTTGLLAQRVHGLEGVDRFLLELAREGELVSTRSERKIQLDPHKLTRVGKSVVWELAQQFAGQFEARALQTTLGIRLRTLGVETIEDKKTAERRLFQFPRRPDFQRRVEALLGIKLEVEDDGIAYDEIAGGAYKKTVPDEWKVIRGPDTDEGCTA